MATLNDVRRLAMALPEVAEHPSYDGQASWTVKGKGFVWERPLRKSDLAELGDDAPSGPILGVRTEDLEMKDAMLASEPGIFFTTSHFDGYPSVLVRLNKIGLKLLKQVIVDAWLTRAPKRLANEFLKDRV
ncbi:MAG TPA: hypothetical protein VFL13_10245 [Candidatus Baltobacteraceae bacterium]|nr:hypothetical protein [Candidatus Baltobacteraceae bacterium]